MLYWYAFYYVNQNWFSNYQYHPLTWLAAEAGNLCMTCLRFYIHPLKF